MTDGNIDIALLKYDAGSQTKEALALGGKTGIHHFGFEVDSVDEFAKELKSRGLEVISNPGVIPLKFKVPGGGVAEVAPRKHFKID
jgi:4-hydroxyphenylpyruvate dioxygenase-like putative hemolysin